MQKFPDFFLWFWNVFSPIFYILDYWEGFVAFVNRVIATCKHQLEEIIVPPANSQQYQEAKDSGEIVNLPARHQEVQKKTRRRSRRKHGNQEENIKKAPQEENTKKVPQEENIKKVPQEENIKKVPQEENTKKAPQELKFATAKKPKEDKQTESIKEKRKERAPKNANHLKKEKSDLIVNVQRHETIAESRHLPLATSFSAENLKKFSHSMLRGEDDTSVIVKPFRQPIGPGQGNGFSEQYQKSRMKGKATTTSNCIGPFKSG